MWAFNKKYLLQGLRSCASVISVCHKKPRITFSYFHFVAKFFALDFHVIYTIIIFRYSKLKRFAHLAQVVAYVELKKKKRGILTFGWTEKLKMLLLQCGMGKAWFKCKYFISKAIKDYALEVWENASSNVEHIKKKLKHSAWHQICFSELHFAHKLLRVYSIVFNFKWTVI